MFPFGQLVRLDVAFQGKSVPLLGIDFLAGLATVWVIYSKTKKSYEFKHLLNILLVFLVSFLLSFAIFPPKLLLLGFLYLVRLGIYLGLYVLVRNFTKSKENRSFLMGSMLVVVVFTAIFGWLQYYYYPDLRSFTVWGWDDHLLRLTGTFFDPGYSGLIYGLGAILAYHYYYATKSKKYGIMAFFLAITVLFTYSRASIIALLLGTLMYFGYVKRNMKKMGIIITLMFVLGSLLLPRGGGAGVMLERTFSIFSRLIDYRGTLLIWQKFPLFGVGYNNICFAKQQILGYGSLASHSCFGADSSLLLILATTGIAGLLIIASSLKLILLGLRKSRLKAFVYASLLTILVHSLFVNSLFYSWVIVWMIFTLSLGLGTKLKS